MEESEIKYNSLLLLRIAQKIRNKKRTLLHDSIKKDGYYKTMGLSTLLW